MTTVLAIMIAVIMDRWAQHIPGGEVILRSRSVNWLKNYTNKMSGMINNVGFKQSYLLALCLWLPLCLAYLILKIIIVLLMGVSGAVLFAAIVLFYLLGNNQTEQHKSEFVTAHERSFAILFWFAALGNIGALTYWFLVVLTQTKQVSEETNEEFYIAIDWLHAVAAWIPARITGFIYALVGNFTAGFNSWLTAMRTPTMQSSEFLADCGQASVDAAIANDGVNLVNRAFIAWVVLSILIVVFK